jgi:biotin transport system substrate-specific component
LLQPANLTEDIDSFQDTFGEQILAVHSPSLIRPNTLLGGFGIALYGAALITLGAKVQIPFWPVPMTLHTLAVFLVAAAFGPRFGTAAMLTYLAAGASGLPVFSGSPERGIGHAYMMGPTGGYLLGYLLSAAVIGAVARGRGLVGHLVAMGAGLAVVYACGLAWLSTFVPSAKLLGAGLTPFLLGDLIKVVLAAIFVTGFLRLKGRAE